MSNSTGGTTSSKPPGSQATPPNPASSEAMSDVAWVADEQTREAMIRLAAYTFYERRGYVSGSELEDWLEAEMEVDRQLTATQRMGHAPDGIPEHLHTIAPVQTRARPHAEPAPRPAMKSAAKVRPKMAAAGAAPPAKQTALQEPAAAAAKKSRPPKQAASSPAKPRSTGKI